MSIGKNKLTPNADFIADYAACLRAVADVADYDAIIATNTTNARGLAFCEGWRGRRALRRTAHKAIARGRSARGRPIDVVASGGIMTAADAHAALAAGAKAVQLYTGFIYRGPALIREIVAGL
ncbi:nitronate monooxygenase [Trueperella pyogenes]|uniref:nitronate monooxygenase n=1 Tax=Trueperella pyogenes TaxID=1661 RepID=UPI001ADDEF58|nr:nitronate monooxygenase [Trueperella pyogenes]